MNDEAVLELLFLATLGVTPGGPPLENDERVQAYLTMHPGKLAAIQRLDRILKMMRAKKRSSAPM